MQNQKGFTLSEILTGVALMSIVMLGVASVMFFMNYTYLSKKDRLEAEQAAANAEWLLKLVFSQAIDVGAATTGNLTTATSVGANITTGANVYGQVLQGRYDRIIANQWIKIAAFQREVGQALGGTNFGAIARTAIYFRRPEAGPPGTSGVLFFDMGTRNAAGTAPGATPMTPTYADEFVPRVSYLEIIKTTNGDVTIDRTTSLEFRMRFRYHDKVSNVTTWCPQQNLTGGGAVIAACNPAGALWHDLDRRFTVLLRNNWIRRTTDAVGVGGAGATEDRVLGNLYFFAPVTPDRTL